MTWRRYLFPLTLLVATLLFVTVNMLGTRLLSRVRFDFTEHHIFTLSEGTRQVLQGLEEPITIRFFYTDKQATGYPALQSYATRVRGILEQYARTGGDKVKLEIIDPEPFSEAEDLAVAFGAQGVPVGETGARLFLGISMTGPTDKTVAIPFLDPDRQNFLEYDLSRLIDDAAHPAKPRIGLISGLPMQGGISQLMKYEKPWAIFAQLQESFTVIPIPVDAKTLPKDLSVLMVVYPTGLQPDLLYAIDQYMLGGGKAIFYLDAYSGGNQAAESANLPQLFDAWGVQLMPSRLAADPEAAMRVQIDAQSDSAMQSASNITWLNLSDDETINRQDVATAQLRMVRMIESGYFVLRPDAPVKATALLMTHKPAQSLEVAALKEEKLNPVTLQEKARNEPEKLALALRIEGKVKTAFPKRNEAGQLMASTQPLHAVLVADSDMLRDAFWVNMQEFFGKTLYVPTSDNGSFALNLVDTLAGNPALIGLRSRGTEERPFTVVTRMRQQAEQKFHSKELALKARLKELEETLRNASENKAQGGALFTENEQAEMGDFRQELLATRKELRGVQRNLDEDINRLNYRLQWLNIGLMPILVLVLAFFVPRWLGVRRAHRAKGA